MSDEKKNSVVAPQKDPIKNENNAVWDSVIKDIVERDQRGLEKYGTRLQPFNSRDATIDAYQEVLDLVVYFKQSVEERKVIVDFLKKVSKLQHDIGYEAYTLLRNLGEV